MPAAHSPVAYAPTVDIEFVASVAVIAADPALSRELYVDALGLPLKASEGDDYIRSENVAGVKHFGVWPLAQVAQACFGTGEWPQDRPVPQASIEFEVADAAAVQAAAAKLEAQASNCCTMRAKSPGTDRRTPTVGRGADHRSLLRALAARRCVTRTFPGGA